MSAPGVEPHPHKRHAIRIFQNTVGKRRLLHALPRRVRHEGHPSCLVPRQQVTKRPLRTFRSAMDDGQIFFAELVFPNLSGQLRRRAGVSRQHHHAADHPVEPVHRAHVGLGVAQSFPHQLRQSPRLVGGEDSRRLDADQNISVLIQNFHRAPHKSVFPILSKIRLFCKEELP